MGRGKRKTGDLHGRVKPSKELEESEDPDQIQMVVLEVVGGGDSDEDRADGDPLMQETEHLNPTGIVGDELDEGQGRSAYLVACHWDWSEYSKPYAVYKVDVATSYPSRVKRKRLHRVTRLATVAGGKTFTSVRSMHRVWIIGVGGDPGDTVIFDTKTKKVIHGPTLNSKKWCPVLTTVGDKVYALSKTPSWLSDPDFPPWFEVLDLSKAKVVTVDGCSHLEGCSWIELPHPPCFPWKLTPLDYMMLPVVVVKSYVLVDTYILVSFNQLWGTYAFDTNSVDWHKVDNQLLPFIGRATPHGSLFLGLSKHNGPINAYRINVTTPDKDHAPNLSITVLPVKYMDNEVDAGPCFFSLEDGCFCSFSFSLDSCSITLHPKKRELFPKEAHLNLRTYQTENPSSLEVQEETLLAVNPEVAVCSQWEQAFKICSSHGFCPSAFALLSV